MDKGDIVMKKILMKKNEKNIIIISLFIIALVFGLISIFSLFNNGVKIEENEIYSHSWEETTKWSSLLKPNEIIESKYLFKDDYIFIDLTKSVNVFF